MISVPSGGSNQSVMNMFGVPKYTVNMAQGPNREDKKLWEPRQEMRKLARQGAVSKPWRN
jgi:hypothetical protein